MQGDDKLLGTLHVWKHIHFYLHQLASRFGITDWRPFPVDVMTMPMDIPGSGVTIEKTQGAIQFLNTVAQGLSGIFSILPLSLVLWNFLKLCLGVSLFHSPLEAVDWAFRWGQCLRTHLPAFTGAWTPAAWTPGAWTQPHLSSLLSLGCHPVFLLIFLFMRLIWY